MPSVVAVARLARQLDEARVAAADFFRETAAALDGQIGNYEVPPNLSGRATELSARFHAVLVRLASMVRESPMFGPADLNAVQLVVRRVDAALRLRQYREWGPEVLHDEDTVLAVKPAGFSEDLQLRPADARPEIEDAIDQALRRLGILHAQAEAEAAGEASPIRLPTEAQVVGVQPGTAFIIMMIDPEQPELEDVKQAIQEEFARFGIRAMRSDDVEHSDEITPRILEAIRTSEFLIADLTGERPSVYYEVGYAHAIGKRPILYKRVGTRLHFDLAIHNCPDYRNITELRDRLRRRLTAMTGRE